MGKLKMLILSVVLMMPLVQGYSLSAADAEPAVIHLVHDDFENEQIGSLPSGYSSNNNSVTSTVYVDKVPADSIGNPSSKALRIYDQDGPEANRSRTIVSKHFGPQQESFVVELDVMEPKWVGNSYPLRIEDKANGDTALALEISGGNLGYRGSDGAFKGLTLNGEAIHLTPGTWYRVKVLTDMLNQAADIYLDGSYIGNVSFMQQVSSLDAIEGQTAGSSMGDLYWDHVQVYVEATDSPKNLTAFYGDQTVELSWMAAKGASSYNVKRSTTDGGPYETVAAGVTETRYVDIGLTNDVTYYYVVTAVNSVGESQPSNQVSITPSIIPNPPGTPVSLQATARDSQVDISWKSIGETKSILFVGIGNDADEATMDHLRTQGYEVTFKLDNEVVGTDAEGHDLVFIGESSSSSRIGSKFKQLTIPVIYAEPFALDDVNLSTSNSGDFGSYDGQTSLRIVDSSHPLAAGLSGKVEVYTQAGKLNYGKPGSEAIVIATVPDDNNKAVIFAYEQGSKDVAGDIIPARRAATFLFAGQEPYTTAEGWALIDQSVQWALGIEEHASPPVDTYKIKRSTNPNGDFITIAEVSGEETMYRDSGLDNGITYYYVVTAENIGGESESSQTVSIVPAAPLQIPTGLSAVRGDRQVMLSWNPVEGAVSYNVKRSERDGLDYKVIASGITETTFTDTALSNGSRYYYVVSASNETSASTNSESVTAVPAPNNGAPAIPTGIEAAAGDGQVILTWPEVDGATAYNVKRGAFNSGSYTVIASNVSAARYQDVGLENGVTYDYVVTAMNENGESYASEPIAVTPARVVVVAKDGSGDFTTVQEAVNAAPDYSDKRHVIYIKNGEYREKLTVPESKSKLSFVGESKESTVLVYNDNANTPDENGSPMGTSRSSSVFIYADDFIAKNLTIQNDSGQGTGQAVAAYVRGDRAYFENVRFLGYQDTLYTNNGRHYYKNVYIEGDVDFIFGQSTAVFDRSQIHAKRDGSMLTAASTSQEQPYGYVFLNSTITSDEGIENIHFGRPWRPYSAVAFINTEIHAKIAPYGWDHWGNEANEKTARYEEYNSSGPGANPKDRAPWSKQLTPQEADRYTVQNVLKGNDQWDPTRIGMIPLDATSAPVISVDQQDSIVNTAEFIVSGRLDKEARVFVNGDEIALHSDFTFSTTVRLEPMQNTITIEAVDADGIRAVPVVVNVIYDYVNPVITLDGPEGDKKGNHYNTIYNPYPVKGQLSEAGSVQINGMPVEVNEDFTFEAEIELGSGMNEIIVTSQDLAGNLSEPVSFKVVPKGNSVPAGPIRIVDARVKDEHTIELTLNSKVEFDPNDVQLLSAMGKWDRLNPQLTPNVTIQEVSTRVINQGKQTVVTYHIEETLNPDGSIVRPIEENPEAIPHLDADYYSSDLELSIQQAEYLLSWQLDSGAWYKNMEDKYNRYWDGVEPKSEVFSSEHGYIGTIDNSATTNEILFLALMYKETGDERYRDSVLKGIEYLLEAQYETGAWPQFYPLRGGYSDYGTFNDNATIRVMNVLTMVSDKEYPFNSDLVDEQLIERTKSALELGLDYILKTQIVVDGKLTAWCAQHDPYTYEPREARSYEHPSLSGSESVGIVKYLMALENPSPEVQAAIEGALTWFEEAKVEGVRYVSGDPNGQYFYEDPESNTWYRFYEIGTNRPIFSGRDGVIKHDILEIEQERRDGYRWAGEWPEKLLEIARTTGYYENRIYVKIIDTQTRNAAGKTLQLGELIRIEGDES
ncbi:pectate lyase [Marinicrinis lubricantis]|uniref:Pectate lyase n=1 Tax=Marinicrinis lubricantis TaxID=2086470 RepID=A0ABW1IR40_9BACL